MDKAYLTTQQAADFLGICPKTLFRLRNKGQGPDYYRFGSRTGAIRYKVTDLELWIASRKHSQQR